MNVEQCMTRSPKTCGPNDSLARAAQIMWENDCGCVPVVDDARRIVGIITDRDVCMAAYTKGGQLHALNVAGAMAKKVFSCQARDSLESAERLMQNHQVRRLPVVDDDDRIVGVLALSDVVRETRAAADGKGRDPGKDPQVQAFMATFTAICEPRRKAPAPAAPLPSPAAQPPSKGAPLKPTPRGASSTASGTPSSDARRR